MGTQAFRGADVLSSGCGELEIVWPFGGAAQLVGPPLEQRGCPMSGTQASGHYAQGVNNRLADEASVRTTAPNGCAVLSSWVD